MFLSKKLLPTALGLCLVSLSLGATEPQSPAKAKKIYYNPYYMLVGRSMSNLAGAAICCFALEKAMPTYQTLREIGQIGNIFYFMGRQAEAFQKFEREKRNWFTIQRCNEVIRKWNTYCKNVSKKTF